MHFSCLCVESSLFLTFAQFADPTWWHYHAGGGGMSWLKHSKVGLKGSE